MKANLTKNSKINLHLSLTGCRIWQRHNTDKSRPITHTPALKVKLTTTRNIVDSNVSREREKERKSSGVPHHVSSLPRRYGKAHFLLARNFFPRTLSRNFRLVFPLSLFLSLSLSTYLRRNPNLNEALAEKAETREQCERRAVWGARGCDHLFVRSYSSCASSGFVLNERRSFFLLWGWDLCRGWLRRMSDECLSRSAEVNAAVSFYETIGMIIRHLIIYDKTFEFSMIFRVKNTLF